MDKSVLKQYASLLDEKDEVKSDIKRLEKRISYNRRRIAEMEANETVKDHVRGGLGGVEGFSIEGVPFPEYRRRSRELYREQSYLLSQKVVLQELEIRILEQVVDVRMFMNDIDDSLLRRIVKHRVVDRKTWNEVADAIGGNNTADSVRMIFQRYVASA